MKIDSTLPEQKIELIQWVSALEDKTVIEKLLQIRKDETKDWWQTIGELERASILKGLEDVDTNNIQPHSSAMKLYEKWL